MPISQCPPRSIPSRPLPYRWWMRAAMRAAASARGAGRVARRRTDTTAARGGLVRRWGRPRLPGAGPAALARAGGAPSLPGPVPSAVAAAVVAFACPGGAPSPSASRLERSGATHHARPARPPTSLSAVALPSPAAGSPSTRRPRERTPPAFNTLRCTAAAR
jgi:hypothetical protein